MDFLDFLKFFTGNTSFNNQSPNYSEDFLTEEEILDVLLGGAEEINYDGRHDYLSPIEVDLQDSEEGFRFDSLYDFSAEIEAYKNANRAGNAIYRKSLRYKNAGKDKAREVAYRYKGYQANIKQLTKKQLNWYLYWRTNFKRGNYLKADPGYILIYATEILDGMGWKEPLQGLNILLTLFDRYKDTNIDLENRLLNWIFDFCVFYDLPFDVDRFPFNAFLVNDFFINLYLMNLELKDFKEVDTVFLEEIQKYKFHDTVFYKKNPELVDDVIRLVLKAVDEYYFETYEFGFFDYYLNYDRRRSYHYLRSSYRHLFEGSVTIFNDFYIKLPSFDFINSSNFKKDLSEVLKFTVNEVRKVSGSRGRNIKTTLSPELQELITRKVSENLEQTKNNIRKKKREEFKLDVDLKIVDKLEQDFELNKERLYVEAEEEQEDLEKYTKSTPDLTPSEQATGELLYNVEALDGELKDLLENLDLNKQKVLKTILISSDPLTKVKELANSEGTFLETLIDEINETAYEFIGEELVELTEDSLICSEEYQEALKEVLI